MSREEPLPERVAALVARFEEIERTVMRGLPVCNPALAVEAIGFRPFAEGWLGVLITPWFMNAMLLPGEPEPVDWSRIGQWVERALPGGPRRLMIAGDEVIGAYLMLSLHSPMDAFAHPAQARSEAFRRLLELTTPPEPEGEAPTGAGTPPGRSRRALLGGRAGSA